MAHGLSCSAACGIFPDQGSNLCPLNWQVDSFFFFFFNVLIYFWLCWVFVSVRGLSPVAASGGHSSSRCAGLSLSQPLPLWSTGSRRAGSGSVVVAHGPSRSAACGIFPDRDMNLCPLHWQADSQPLSHQGSPAGGFLTTVPTGKSYFLILKLTVKLQESRGCSTGIRIAR